MTLSTVNVQSSRCILEGIKSPIPVGSETYNDVLAFLYNEAWLLDHQKFGEWYEYLATDLLYIAPVQVTRSRASGGVSLTGRTNYHYFDDFKAMTARVRRLTNTTSAWSDDPPVRLRRSIANVMVGATATEGEFHVRSYIQIARNRFEEPNQIWISAERNDLLRRNGDSFQIARREILLDSSVLVTPNLAFFI